MSSLFPSFCCVIKPFQEQLEGTVHRGGSGTEAAGLEAALNTASAIRKQRETNTYMFTSALFGPGFLAQEMSPPITKTGLPTPIDVANIIPIGVLRGPHRACQVDNQHSHSSECDTGDFRTRRRQLKHPLWPDPAS